MDTLHPSPSVDLKGDGYQVLGQNHDWWPEKAHERAQRAVKPAPIRLTQADLERIIAPMLDRQAREAAARAKAAA